MSPAHTGRPASCSTARARSPGSVVAALDMVLRLMGSSGDAGCAAAGSAVDELEVEARRRIDHSQPIPAAGSTVKVNIAFMPHAPGMASAIDCDGYASPSRHMRKP